MSAALWWWTGSADLARAWIVADAGTRCAIVALLAVAAVINATRQHALGVIMHDAAHRSLFARRALNDALSDWCCAFPIGLCTAGYRAQHLPHHAGVNTDADPYWRYMPRQSDWTWPGDGRRLAGLIIGDLAGLNLGKWARVASPWTVWARAPGIDRRVRLRYGLWLLVVIGAIAMTGSWLMVLCIWVVPSLTVLMAFARIRALAEHVAMPVTYAHEPTRHVEGTLLERLSIAPLNVNMHIAHHLYPHVPHYRLPELHRLLLDDPGYRQHAWIVPTYLGRRCSVLAELLTAGAQDVAQPADRALATAPP